MSENNNALIKSNQEVDLIEIVRMIWKEKRLISKVIIVCVVIGIIFTIGTPKSYKTECKLLIESGSVGSGASGLLQQFGGLAGINLFNGKGEETLTPLLYPDIVKTTPFLLELLEQKIQLENEETPILTTEYISKKIKPSLFGIIKKYTIGLPGTIINLIKGNSSDSLKIIKVDEHLPIKISSKLNDQLNALSGLFVLSQDDKTGVITLVVETQDRYMSATLSNNIINLLTKYIIEYRIQKARVDYEFIAERQHEAENKYRIAQANLARFKDQNKNIVLATTQTNLENFQEENNLAFNLYNSLSQQLEQAKIRVQEKTPVFKIMEPAVIPINKSKPRTFIIIVSMFMLGLLGGSAFILLKKIFIKN